MEPPKTRDEALKHYEELAAQTPSLPTLREAELAAMVENAAEKGESLDDQG